VRRNHFIRHVIEGKVHGRIEVTGRRGRRRERYRITLRKTQDTGN